jgi:putative heme transporter
MARPHMIWTRRARRAEPHDAGDGERFAELTPDELNGVFTPPGWLRELGTMCWLLVGIGLLVAAIIAVLSLTETIVTPVIAATIVAAVASPLVRGLERRGIRRAVGAALVFVSLAVAGVLLTYMVLNGITSQTANIQGRLDEAATRLESWLRDAGVGAAAAEGARDDVSGGLSAAFDALLNGLGVGINALASIAVFLSFAALSLFFLLKDGPVIRRWAERHLGLPPAVGRLVTGRTLGALRGYFVGVTAVAAFNAAVIGLGALLLGVPLAGSIAAVNFVAAYVPYVGAWSAGAFTVLIALGAEGPTAALAMAVIALLANGALQQLVQPIAMGATLGLHPLAALIVTVAGGGLFGTVGLVLAAPLTSAALHLNDDLARARSQERSPPAPAPPTNGDPVPSGP